MRKQKSSTTSGKGVYNNLGIDGGQRSTKKKKELTRKEVKNLSVSYLSYEMHNDQNFTIIISTSASKTRP
jgi:hypothetical protein